MRLLIFLFLIYFGYRYLKKWLRKNVSFTSMTGGEDSKAAVDDIMVKDPYCQTYFPQRSGVHLNFNGQDLYFCSTKCRDEFLSAQQKEQEAEK